MNCKICTGKTKKIITFEKGHLNENLFGLENKNLKDQSSIVKIVVIIPININIQIL